MIHRKRGLLYPLLPSRSYADARIETYAPAMCWILEQHRVPMRTRGLKLVITAAAVLIYKSRSYADARIETSVPSCMAFTRKIAFLCGRADWNKADTGAKSINWNRVPMRTRGLKLFPNSHASCHTESRSYADARIETLSHCETLSIVSIAFLCGRADWNTLSSIVCPSSFIAFLCGRADWNSLRSAWIKA